MLKRLLRDRRHRRLRARVKGTAKRPRLSVFRSNKHIYAQLIDDEKNNTLLSACDLELNVKKEKGKLDKISGKILTANKVGQLIAKKALDKKIKFVVFDRGGFKYMGRVKAIADGARKGGLRF